LGNEAAQPEDFAEQGQGATHSWLDRRSASRFGGWASAASFIGNIPEHYDSGLGPIIFVDYAADIARRAEACGPARVPETAAGTGIVTRKLRGQRRRKTLAEDPGSTRPELRIPSGAAQTRIVSVARIRLDSWKSLRSFKGIICADISEFESHMPSHAVVSLSVTFGPVVECPPGYLRVIALRSQTESAKDSGHYRRAFSAASLLANLLLADYLTRRSPSVRHRGRERKTASGAGSGLLHYPRLSSRARSRELRPVAPSLYRALYLGRLASTHPPLAPPKEAGPEVSEVRPKLACPRSYSETSITLAAKPG
jgi:hypothetical protein